MLTSLWDETHYSKSFQYQVNSPLNLFELLYSQISPTTIIWTFSDGPAFELVPKEKNNTFHSLFPYYWGVITALLQQIPLETCWEIKTESTRKLSTFNSQWTKTLYQNNLKNIATFFLHFSRCLVFCTNTKDYFSWEPEKMNVKFYKNCKNTGKILKISCVRCHLWNLTFIFWVSHKRFSLVLLQMTNYIFRPWKT